jgi:predicted nucleotidyltransferase
MLDTLITSKTRLKLLLKFFLNSGSKAYLRQLESEFGESSNAIRLELNRFEKANLLTASTTGNKKYFRANTKHPLFPDINNILMKYVGFDQIVDKVVRKLGNLKCAYIVGDFARGKDNRIIDLIFVCNGIDREYLARLIGKVEKLINRKIRYVIFNEPEFKSYATRTDAEEVLLLWKE